jgi:hypothetical protein
LAEDTKTSKADADMLPTPATGTVVLVVTTVAVMECTKLAGNGIGKVTVNVPDPLVVPDPHCSMTPPGCLMYPFAPLFETKVPEY